MLTLWTIQHFVTFHVLELFFTYNDNHDNDRINYHAGVHVLIDNYQCKALKST